MLGIAIHPKWLPKYNNTKHNSTNLKKHNPTNLKILQRYPTVLQKWSYIRPGNSHPNSVMRVNTGSSSLKVALYRLGEKESEKESGQLFVEAERIGLPHSLGWVEDRGLTVDLQDGRF